MTQPDIVDLILIDHRSLKDCISILKNEDANKRQKLSKGKIFLETLKAHAQAEEICLYARVKNEPDLRSIILEGIEEHSIANEKLAELMPKFKRAQTISDELEAQIKVLAEIVEHHIKEEESVTLPLLRSTFEADELIEIGLEFMEARDFTKKQLRDTPILKDELKVWTNTAIDMSKKFKEKTQRYMQSMR